MIDQFQTLLPYLAPVFAIGMWMLATTIIGFASGWFRLQQHFASKPEPSLLTLRMQSGRMGFCVQMQGALTLAACPSGLRVKMFRLLGPFQKPFTVPWGQIEAKSRKLSFSPGVRLSFGYPEIGNLTIDARLWQQLTSHSPIPLPAEN